MTNFQSFVPDSLTTISNKKTYLPRLSTNSEADASELPENLEEMFPGTACITMFLTII